MSVADVVVIPHLANMDDQRAPGWITSIGYEGKQLKPVIRCKCGRLVGIGAHHVDENGIVSASFHHDAVNDPLGACGWHVYLKLEGYDGLSFPAWDGR